MLIEEFEKWKKSPFGFEYAGQYPDEQDLFGIFYQGHTCGQSIAEVINKLAWQIYNLQVCIEGLIEDQEF